MTASSDELWLVRMGRRAALLQQGGGSGRGSGGGSGGSSGGSSGNDDSRASEGVDHDRRGHEDG